MKNIYSQFCERTGDYRSPVALFIAYILRLGSNCNRFRVNTNDSGTDCHYTLAKDFHWYSTLRPSFESHPCSPISIPRYPAYTSGAFSVRSVDSILHLLPFMINIHYVHWRYASNTTYKLITEIRLSHKRFMSNLSKMHNFTQIFKITPNPGSL